MAGEQIAKTLDIFFNGHKAPKKWNDIDRLEQMIITKPRVEGDLKEYGSPGMYVREITIPAGTLITSKIHKTFHQFVVSKGAIACYNTVTDKDEIYEAHHHGFTYPGTRRVLYTFTEVVWSTFHPTDKIKLGFENLDSAEQQCIFDNIMSEDIIQEYYNPLIVDFNEGVFL